LKPGEVPATDVAGFVATADVANGRFAVLCTASISGDTGGLATTGVCARVVDGRRLLIIVALAKMKSFVEESVRDRRAVTFRSFPEGEDPRKAGIIVVLLRETTRRVLRVSLHLVVCGSESGELSISYNNNFL
jgi:hypothetical protein